MLDGWPLRGGLAPSVDIRARAAHHWPTFHLAAMVTVTYSRETAACRAKNNQCWNKGLLKERVTLLQIGRHVLTVHRSLRCSPSLVRTTAKWRLRPFISQLSGIVSLWIFMFNCFSLLPIHFTGLAHSLSLSSVAPDNHCICALFSHRCGNHYGSWSSWQHTVPIPPSRTGRGIKQHELSGPMDAHTFTTIYTRHTLIVDLNCAKDTLKS